MANVSVYNMEGNEVGTLELNGLLILNLCQLMNLLLSTDFVR